MYKRRPVCLFQLPRTKLWGLALKVDAIEELSHTTVSVNCLILFGFAAI
jgi:hypothetical protein